MSDEVFSPRKGVIGDNFSVSTDWKESRQALKNTLKGKLSYDHIRVFGRLGVSEIDDTSAERCAQDLLRDLADDIRALKVLVNLANTPRNVTQLNMDPGHIAVNSSAKAQELAMYPYLVSSHAHKWLAINVLRHMPSL